MWHALISALSRIWPYVLSGVVGSSLTAGFVYLLKRREERRDLRKKLTAELYLPARRQLSEALQLIEKRERALAVDMEGWKRACSTGVTRRVRASLRLQLEALYERTLPGFDRAWMALNDEIGRMAREWDAKFADLCEYSIASKEHKIVEVRSWNFLTEDAPVTPIDGLRERDVLRLWDAFMTPARFKALDRSPEQFLIERWQEAARNDAMRQFRELRRRALQEIPKAVALLDRCSLL